MGKTREGDDANRLRRAIFHRIYDFHSTYNIVLGLLRSSFGV
jgi:hypothetical protein